MTLYIIVPMDNESFEQREERLARRRLKRYGREHRVNHRRTQQETQELRRARAKAYYYANREEKIAYQIKRRNADKAAARAYEREVYKRRSAKAQATNRARERGMENPTPLTVKYDSLLRNDPCGFCGAKPVQVDHIEPVSKGGPNHWSNLTALCRSCNRKKSNKPLLIGLLT